MRGFSRGNECHRCGFLVLVVLSATVVRITPVHQPDQRNGFRCLVRLHRYANAVEEDSLLGGREGLSDNAHWRPARTGSTKVGRR